MKKCRRMIIRINYQDEKYGNLYITSPRGGKNEVLWRIGSAFLLFGGWLMFGQRKEWSWRTHEEE